MVNFLSLILPFVTSLLQIVGSTTFYVIPDRYSLHHYPSNNTFTLQHYLNNTSEYFVSYNELHFLPGQYYINNDLTFQYIYDFTLTGHGINQSFITCSSSVNIVVENIEQFVLQNISIFNCMRFTAVDQTDSYYMSIFFYKCHSVFMHNLYFNINASAPGPLTGVFIMNVAKSTILNVKVQLNTSVCLSSSLKINGLAIYYNKNKPSTYSMQTLPNVLIKNFRYTANKPCLKNLQCAIGLMLVHIRGLFTFVLQDTVFTNFSNSSAFCYYTIADSKTSSDEDTTEKYIMIKDVTVSHNTGYGNLNMFQYALYSVESQLESPNNFYSNAPIRLYNRLMFSNCHFINNTNINAMIYVHPPSYSKVEGNITIFDSIFFDNKDVSLIKITRNSQTLPNVITHIWLVNVTMLHNEHHYNGENLITVTNGRIYFLNTDLTANHYYENLINLHSSMLYFEQSNRITENYARYIIKAQRDSFLFMNSFATVIISNNIVYKITKQVSGLEKPSVPICPLQVYDLKHNKQFYNLDQINCTFLVLNNTEMISKSLPDEISSFMDKQCIWLDGTVFRRTITNTSAVYHKIAKFSNTFISKVAKRFVPLSVCPCLQNDSYNCYAANLGSVFPGQTLHMKLIISQRWSNVSSTLIVANTKYDDCSIIDSYQLSQIHPTNGGCCDYNFTIWPNSEHITECKLFIGLSEMPEMFYVQLKACPVGFTLQSNKKSCYCDPLLNNGILSVASCNLDDKTILRPAYSWIIGDTSNNSHAYKLSPHCPFDYCLPYSSHLNLFNPDAQCQFERSGVVCGKCKQGLSTVLGSTRCKQCSNFYLFLIIPLAIAGIVLVIMLFTFNLTVTNGIINTLIFYVNIISINYSHFCFGSHSPECTILAMLNLDLGIETCFYDGMDGYTKMWLQLAFPSYLMLIAFSLIIGSRYSIRLQKLTATRVLKVLATIFFLSYTKLLLTVSQVLFFFSSFTHLPSKHTTLVWSVDTSVVLLGVPFCLLYIVCLILFLILLIFNALLLFPRTVSRCNFINRFKPLLDAYFGPYKQNYSFWTGLQLLIRAGFFALSALSKNLSLCFGAILVGIILCVHVTAHPFKSRFKNFQESFILLNLLAVYITALYSDSEENRYKILIIRSFIVIVLLYFIGLILCHCVMIIFGDAIKKKGNKIKQLLIQKVTKKQTSSQSFNIEHLSSRIPDAAFNYKEFREPLVAVD